MHQKSLRGVRAVALVEATKAVLVLLAGFGLLALLHRDAQALAERFVRAMHANPAHKYPQIFIEAAASVNDSRLWSLATFAGIYALVRGVEAYGLWHDRKWAEWLALLSGGIYLPLEIYEIIHHVTWVKVVAFMVNLLVVFYMVKRLRQRRKPDAGIQ
ncbi:MAG: DUF2127 domain-containing protein [Verrucomicrobium sp.]|nr:DUF2127 domain-containing protein [Verrucomicrobium sp.]